MKNVPRQSRGDGAGDPDRHDATAGSAPRGVALLLRLAAPAERRDDVLGDLEEAHGRRLAERSRRSAALATSLDALLVALALSFVRLRGTLWALTDWAGTAETRLALRLIRRQPFFASTAILALAVGIAIAATGFSVLESTLWAGLPFEDGERFVRIEAHTEPLGHPTAIDAERFALFAERAATFEHLGAIGGSQVTLGRSGQLEPVRANYLTPSSLARTGARPLLGRLLDLAAGADGAEGPTVLLRESLWQRRFSRSREVLGQTLAIDGVEHTVIGVLPDDFEFPAGGELWLSVDDRLLAQSGRPVAGLGVFGVLAPGATPAEAAAELDHLSSTLPSRGGGAETGAPTPVVDATTRITVRRYTEPPPGWELGMTVLVSLLVLVLLVIASNVANLIFARTSARTSELAVRAALGAPRRRLVGQIFVEVATLALIAGALGLWTSKAVVGHLDARLDELPFWITLAPGARTVLFVVVISVLASALAGVVPALRVTGRDPAKSLGAAGGRLGFGRFGNAAIAAEMALSVALLAGALVFARGFLLHSTPSDNLPRGQVLTAWVADPTSGADPREALADAIAGLPGVTSWGLGSHVPRVDPPLRRFSLAPEEAADPSPPDLRAPVAWITPGFIETLGGRALAGRLLRDSDLEPRAPRVALVNEPFVDRFLGGRNPLGRRLLLEQPGLASEEGGGETEYEIVGVVPDLGLSAIDPESAAGFYLPLVDGDTDFAYLALRTASEPMTTEAPLRAALAAIAPTLQLRHVAPLEQVGSEDRAMMSGLGTALVATGGLALLLSLVSLWALVTFAVTRRTREIGIRIALGANRRQVLTTVIGGATAPIAAGAALGTLLGMALMRGRALLVTRLPTPEPWILPVVAALLLATGLLACALAARRALDVHPSEALRTD